MKMYYDLSKKERTKYLAEFKKTPVGKEMNFRKICITIIVIALIALSFLLDLEVDGGIDESIKLAMDGIDILWISMFIYEGIYIAYINVNFTAWLKNKYDIKRW